MRSTRANKLIVRLSYLQGTLEAYECKIGTLTAAVAGLEMEVCCGSAASVDAHNAAAAAAAADAAAIAAAIAAAAFWPDVRIRMLGGECMHASGSLGWPQRGGKFKITPTWSPAACNAEPKPKTLHACCLQLACKDEQIQALKSVVTKSPDELRAELVAAHDEKASLRAQLAQQQEHQQHQEQQERWMGQQLIMLKAALVQANSRLKALGARPVAAAKAEGCTQDANHVAAMDQHLLSPARMAPLYERPSPDLSDGGPCTPLSPGQMPLMLQHSSSVGDDNLGSSWDCSATAVGLVRCSSPAVATECAGADRYADADEPGSPHSDLSGPTCGGEEHACSCGDDMEDTREDSGATVAAAAAEFSNRLARDNPLFRTSFESRRTGRGVASVEGSSVLLQASVEEGPLRVSGRAAFGLAKAQLEIQVRACMRLHGACIPLHALCMHALCVHHACMRNV